MRVLPRFLSRTFGRVRGPGPAPDRPLWVVGDIHGRADLLDRLLSKIASHPVSSDPTDLVFVGDYVDRGDDSAGVLRRLLAISRDLPETVFLKGNHEAMMLAFLDAPDGQGDRWLHFGGVQTLGSFGVSTSVFATGRADFAEIADRFRAALPAGMEAWVRRLSTHWVSGTVTVTHAGADPARAIHDQEEAAFVWGHPDFLRKDRSDGAWIVYGHKITEAPGSDGRGRIAVDTGAFHTGILSAALILPDGTVEVVQAT